MAVNVLISSICLNISCDAINSSPQSELEEKIFYYDYNDTQTSAFLKGIADFPC